MLMVSHLGGNTLTLSRTGALSNLTTTISLAGIGGTNAFTVLQNSLIILVPEENLLGLVLVKALEFVDVSGIGIQWWIRVVGFFTKLDYNNMSLKLVSVESNAYGSYRYPANYTNQGGKLGM